jgi:hypothetical protein
MAQFNAAAQAALHWLALGNTAEIILQDVLNGTGGLAAAGSAGATSISSSGKRAAIVHGAFQ